MGGAGLETQPYQMKTSIPSKPLSRTKLGALTLSLLAATPACITQAANIYWTGPTASYNNPTHWAGGVVPGTADNAINTNGLANAVQINAGDPDWTVIDISAGGITDGAGAFQQNGGTLNVNGWLLVGTGTNAVGSFTLNDGTLNVLGGRIFLGDHPGSTSSFTMNGGVINKSGDFFILGDGGWNGDGARTTVFTQNGGIINSTSEFIIGNVPLVDATYNLTGGTNNAGNWLSVGRFGGKGTLNMSGGRINKTGGGNMYVGEGVGTGEFNFTGGVIDITSGEFWVGNGGTSVATMNMSGAASLTVGNWIAVGRNGGAGTLNLTNGTITKIGGGNFAIGAGGGAGSGLINQYGGLIENTANPSSYTYVAENGGSGTWNMFGGAANLGILQFCQGGGGSGTMYLNGGVLSVQEVNCGVAGANGTFYFNGGTLRATAGNGNFFSGLGAAFVDVGGVVIDSQGFNITMAQTLSDMGGGGLTKLGTGALTLTGFNGYTGPTLVNAGKLITTAFSTASGAYSVANNAGFGAQVVYDEAQAVVSELTLAGAATLDFSLGNFGNPTLAPVNVTGTFSVNGAVTVNIASDLPQIGQFPLLQYGTRAGSGSFVIGTLPVGVVASIVTNVGNNTIDLNITSVNLPRWDGQAGGNWDIGLTANWVNIGDGLPTTYGQGNFVLFDDNAAGTTTVNLTTTVNPGSVTVNNSNLEYTMVGSGRISGTIGLVKQGTGTLNVHNTGGNNYTGPTVISGGVLSVTNLANGGTASPIGASSASATNLVIGNNATFRYAGAPVTVNRSYSMGGVSTIATEGDLTLTGNVQANANTRLIKAGPARLIYSAAGSNHLSAGINPGISVANGTVVFNGGGVQTNRVQNEMWVGSTPDFGGSLVLSNTSLIVDSWLAIGRGNGSIGNLSTVTLYDSRLRSGAFSMGWWNNLPGNLSHSILTLNGSSTYTNTGDSNIGESGGSLSEIYMNGTSRLHSNNRLFVGWHNNATGAVTLAESSAMSVNAWFSVGHEGGIGTFTLKDNSSLWVSSDLNMTDVGTGDATMNIQNNAQVSSGSYFIGKGIGSTGVVNQSGGLAIARAVREWHIGFRGVGTWNLSGGSIVAPSHWFIVGRWIEGSGTFNISGGTVIHGTNDTGRLFRIGEDGPGVLNLSGTGDFQTSCNEVTIGWNASGTGTLNLNGGSFQARRVIGGAGTSTVNFNGGVLRAGPNANADFLTALDTANVLAGGAVIDSGTNTINVAQALLDGTGGGGLTKTGNGTLRLNGVNTYTGTTLVNAGTLGGFGTIAGPVNVAAGATLAPGTSIGTLTINNTLQLAGTSTTVMEINKTAATNDLVTGVTTLTYGGTLVLKNLGGELAVNDTFKLFDATSYNGSFANVVSQTVGQTVTWDLSNLTVDGTVRVASAVAAQVTLTSVVNGNTIDLSWPVDQLGWRLEVQTNSLAVGLANNWVTVPNSTNVTSVSVPVVPGNPAVFFRLVFP
jgi:autotransporter-associated beta strand protein